VLGIGCDRERGLRRRLHEQVIHEVIKRPENQPSVITLGQRLGAAFPAPVSCVSTVVLYSFAYALEHLMALGTNIGPSLAPIITTIAALQSRCPSRVKGCPHQLTTTASIRVCCTSDSRQDRRSATNWQSVP
jgi:hypothetical protein